MPIQLDKILSDIANEVVLRPSYEGASKKELDDAWARVGKNNKLSVHETRSIFKVLQKKYEQEKTKKNPSWKLYTLMEQIHQKMEVKPDCKVESESEAPLEEDEEYEMLEVQEEEDQAATQSTQPSSAFGSTSDGESPTKSMKSTSTSGSPDKPEEKQTPKTFSKLINTSNNTSNATGGEEKKLLNTMAPNTTRSSLPSGTTSTAASAAAAALHKKGITMKKTTTGATPGGNTQLRTVSQTSNNAGQTKARTGSGHLLEVGKTIQLPESIKRKLSEEQQQSSNSSKKPNTNTTTTIAQAANKAATAGSNNSIADLQIKQEPEDYNIPATPHGINVITIPANPRVDLVNGGSAGGSCSSTAATVASPRLEEVDFRNGIIFEAGNGLNGGTTIHKLNTVTNNGGGENVNFGNFDNSLPPTFFKNLCNSARHEALGLYVANVMNRLQPRSAAKLELGILRAIIDIQSDELEQ